MTDLEKKYPLAEQGDKTQQEHIERQVAEGVLRCCASNGCDEAMCYCDAEDHL